MNEISKTGYAIIFFDENLKLINGVHNMPIIPRIGEQLFIEGK